MGCWLGVDHGHKRIGIAAGNTEDGIAMPLAVLPAKPAENLFRKITAFTEEYGVCGIVVGWPVNMDGSHGPQAVKARDFAVELAEATGLDVRLWDERLSSFQADQMLAGQMTRKKRRARQDAVAAATFLGEFLTQDGPNHATRPNDTSED